MGIPIFYDKQFLTFDKQIEHLKTKHQLIISDEKLAKQILATISYYDLINGYKECMMDGEKFKKGITIEFLYLFYLFDKNFQNIIFKYSLLVENSFKTKLAYFFADKFSEHQSDYLNAKYFRPSVNKHIVFNKVIREIYSKIRYFNNDTGEYIYTQLPTKHYAECHNHIPPWILMKNISFGNAINLYRLLRKEYKNEFTNFMLNYDLDIKDKINFFTSSLNLIREFRNVVAHNLKFVTFKQKRYQLPLKTTCEILNNKALTDGIESFNNLYACIISIYLSLGPLPMLRSSFMYDIKKLISDNPLHLEAYQQLLANICYEYFKLTDLGDDFIFIDKMRILSDNYKQFP